MVKEAKNVDFYTTGNTPAKEDFARISEWIKKNKESQKKKRVSAKKKSFS